MPAVLKVDKLTRYFNNLCAVNHISFDVQEGVCLGLLGPNGAGKTTTVEMLEGVKKPDSGQISWRGNPVDEHFRQRSGVMFQSTALQDFITVQEALELFQRFYLHTLDLQQIIKDCALSEFLHQEVSKLSGGQRQRLLLAIALVNDPEVLFLDEPTTGLDPQARHNFWKLIEKIKQQNKTVVLTTHYMEEAYRLCDEIIIMDHGEIIAQGTPEALLSRYFNDTVIRIPVSPALEQLAVDTDLLDFSRDQASIEIRTSNINETVKRLLHADVPLDGMQIRERTLEDLFLELTGKAIRQ